jgi:urease accessory protein
MQRSAGSGVLEVALSGGRTKVVRMFQEGSAKIRMPKDIEGSHAEAILINTSGGLTGGDRLDWRVNVEEGGCVSLTTQACEKVYRSSGGTADVSVRLSAGVNARIDWLPQETILFEGGRLVRRVEADLARDAALLVLEAVILGRKAHGEEVETGSFRDSWRIRRDGVLIHAEEMRLDEPFGTYRGSAAALGKNTAFATLLMVDDRAGEWLGAVRETISALSMDGGASAWQTAGSGKLLARIAARDSYALRKALLPLVRVLKSSAAAGYGLPRIWSI